MAAKRPASMGSGFAWAMARAFACVAFGSVAAVTISSERLSAQCARRTVGEQARVCAAALSPSRSGDLRPAVDTLRFEYPALAGIATLDSRGDVQMVYPPTQANSAAARYAAKSNFVPISRQFQGPTGNETLWATSVSLTNTTDPGARQVVFVFRGGAPTGNWLAAAAVSAGVIVVIYAMAYSWLFYWFRGQVLRPLRSLAKMRPRRNGELLAPPTYETNGWSETEGIATSLRTLFRDLKNTDDAVKRSELEAEQQQVARQRRLTNQLRRAEDMAMLDPLTGLRNRRFLETHMERIFNQCSANNEDLSAVMIDLDEFKQLNDTSGHTAGDELLKFVSDIIRGSIRQADHPIRYGGDEFLLLLPRVSAPEARHIVDRISKLFLQNSVLIAGNNNVTLSAGVASLRDNPCRRGQELVANADSALYAAKRNGKNRVIALPAT